jgi:hypothetical protein
MGWKHCVEILFFGIFVLIGVAALIVAVTAVVKGYLISRSLREPQQPKAQAAVAKTEEHKAAVAAHWERWRKRFAGYASDYNSLLNPVRRDTIDIIKESANWGRLAVQYAMIGNGGALAAMPYLLSQTATYKLPISDAIWSATWFATGLISAALCCLIAYLDFQVTAAIYWADIKLTNETMNQRHFETTDIIEIKPHQEMRAGLQAVTIKTGVAGVALGVIAWFALAWGAFRIIISLTP